MTQLLHKRVSFADDLTSWVIKNNIADACEEVKLDFLKLTGWTKKWRMSINAGKTDFILFGKRHQDIVIQIDSTKLPQVKSKKLLGVIIREDLSFNDQVDSICSKCFKAQALLNPLYRPDQAQTITTFRGNVILDYSVQNISPCIIISQLDRPVLS